MIGRVRPLHRYNPASTPTGQCRPPVARNPAAINRGPDHPGPRTTSVAQSRSARETGFVRPSLRARQLRRRLRRRHAGPQEPRDRRAGAHRGVLPEPPRRGRRRGRHRRRRRRPDPGARRVLPGGRRLRPPAGGRVRDRHRVPADRRSPTARVDAVEKVLARRRLRGARLARRPGRRRRAGQVAREVMPAFRQVFVDRRTGLSPATSSNGTSTSRASASSTTSSRRVLLPVAVGAGRRLQGHAHARPAAARSIPTSRDERVETALALVHSRFSTNTFPSWPLAHPYRMLAHNGEINTVQGNENWMRAREGVMASRRAARRRSSARSRSARPASSDTARFDEALELLQPGGPAAAPRDPDDDPRGVGEPRVDGRASARRSTGTTRR